MRSIRPPHLMVAALTLAVGIVATGGSAAAQEPADGSSPAAAALAEQWRIPMGEAEARIARQEAQAALADAARGAYPGSFGGAYIDHARRGVLVVGFTGQVPEADLDRLASRHGLHGVAVGVRVRHSQDRLEQILAALTKRVPAANRSAGVPIQLALRLDLNAVEISRPGRAPATDAQRRFLADATAAFGDAVLSVDSDDVPTSAACDFPSCDSPLRGGTMIYNRDVSCTAGFLTRSKVDRVRYVLTAGHCLDGDPDATWRANGPFSGTRTIGNAHNFTFGLDGDMGIIRVDNTGAWDPRGWVYVTASNGAYPTAADQSYTIAGTALSASLIGTYVCKTGITTGTTCGKVEAVDQQLFYIESGVLVTGLARAKIHSCKGDSGGPVFVRHVAYGLVSGMIPYVIGDSCGDAMYYQGIRGAADAMNVTLLTA